MDLAEQVRDIKAQFRLSMNGVASSRMREQGLVYHLNFGIELPRLREIASEYTPNHELAQILWKENIRESKILATILMPVDRFIPQLADIWVEQIPTQEIAEIAVMNLFQRLPYASSIAFRWVSDYREIFQVCGFLLLTRLCMLKREFNESAAFILLRKYIQIGKKQAKEVLDAIKPLPQNENPRLSGWIDQLRFECTL